MKFHTTGLEHFGQVNIEADDREWLANYLEENDFYGEDSPVEIHESTQQGEPNKRRLTMEISIIFLIVAAVMFANLVISIEALNRKE